MSAHKHTPGPWMFERRKAAKIDVFRRHWGVGQATGEHKGVALAFGEDEANARLIAAAPELLEALESLVYVLQNDDSCPEFVAAKEAIAKATATEKEGGASWVN